MTQGSISAIIRSSRPYMNKIWYSMQNKKNYPASCGGRPELEKSSYSRETHPRMSRETRLRKLDLLSSSTVEASVVGCVCVGADDDDGVGAGIGSSLPPCFRFSSRSFSWRKSSSGLPASGWPSFCWGKFKNLAMLRSVASDSNASRNWFDSSKEFNAQTFWSLIYFF